MISTTLYRDDDGHRRGIIHRAPEHPTDFQAWIGGILMCLVFPVTALLAWALFGAV